ncbi:MAG: class I SAM-dependent methyltransferase [Ignavibacteriae bacterium]|nr:MAG: class I SAM-dependent methyltransferase [Ignavibacteriota bacterium]
MLLEKLQTLKPQKVLDIGCGCGDFTKEMSPYCGHITAIDCSERLIERCKKENNLSNIEYLCMDGRHTTFRDKSFDCVIERASLHHMTSWDKQIDEMFRLSGKHVMIIEPLDDDRSVEKRNLNEAEDFYLEVQHEAGYEHYNHIKKDVLLDYFISRGIKHECIINKFDDVIEFDEYFSMYEYFADKTSNKDYWMNRLNEFKEKLNGGKLCPNDVINIFCITD